MEELEEDIDDEYVKLLLGEITDPRQLFAGTVFKTKKIVEDYKLKRDLVSIGLRRGTDKRPVMARTGMSGDWKRIQQGSRSFELNDEQLNRMWNSEAKELLSKANEIKPNNLSVLNNLGTACKELGDLKKAVSYYEKVIRIRTNGSSEGSGFNIENETKSSSSYIKLENGKSAHLLKALKKM